METEGKKHQRFTKRREKKTVEGSADEIDESPTRIGKDKQRTKYRRKKSNVAFEEDIIDGFAIISFKSFEELEKVVLKNSLNSKIERKDKNSPVKEKRKNPKKRKEKKQNSTPLLPPSSPLRNIEESLDCSPRSDATEVLDFTPSQDQLLSDASTHSSSGRGYLCDSESGDDRASDASSDIFTSVNPASRSRECLVSSVPTCNSPCTNVATTTASFSSSISVSTIAITTPTITTTSALVTATTITNSTTSTKISTATTCSSASTTPITSVIPNSTRPHPPPPLSNPVPAKRSVPPPQPSPPTVSSKNHQGVKPIPRPSSAVQQSHKDLPQKGSSGSPLSRSSGIRPISQKREEYRDPQLPPSLPYSKPWSASGSNPSHHLYSPQISPSAVPPQTPFSLHSSHQNHTPPFASHSSLLSSNQPEANTHGHPGHSMFAPPMPPGPVGGPLSTGGLSGNSNSVHSQGDSMSFANQELLREELNRRFLASQDHPGPSPSSSSLGPPPFRADIHQHQHQHMHQHQHTHQHMYPIPFSGSLGPPPAPLLYDKVPKIESPFFRQSVPGLPSYPAGMSPLIPPAGPGPLNSGIPGAFQPKRVTSSLHPAQMMLASMRPDREKTMPNSVPSLAPQKKGKWCAVHVKVAWEIYQHQQKQLDASKGTDGKPEPLRPPSHLVPGSSLHKPPEVGSATSLLGAASLRQNMRESSPHAGFLNPNPLSMGGFPRPSPYSGLQSGLGGGFGGLGLGPFGPGRDIPAVPGMTSPHEWNRLHRTPPSFPTPTFWPKQLEEREKDREREHERERERQQERELEREKEKERERETLLSLDRRREEERERERRNNERLSMAGLSDRNREREKLFHNDLLRPARSRSRSRSPLQNGRVGSAKSSDSGYERRLEERTGLKIKEERREDDVLHPGVHPNMHHSERDKLRSEFFGAPPASHSLLDRSSLFAPGPSPFLPTDRVPPHPALWSQYEKNSALEFNHHRLQLQQEMEREQVRMISRMQHQHPTASLQALQEQDRLRSREEIMLQDERIRREYLDRIPLYDKDRMAVYEHQSRLAGLRTAELAGAHFQRTMSPMVNHLGVKGGSPACPPPPLIPSSSATSRSHSSSPAVRKPKSLHGSVESLGEKRETFSNSTDPDSHSR